MHVYRSSRSLGPLDRCTLIGKSPLLCATRVAMVFVITLTVCALIARVRSAAQWAVDRFRSGRCRQPFRQLEERPLGHAGSRGTVVQRLDLLGALRPVDRRGFDSARRKRLSAAAEASERSLASRWAPTRARAPARPAKQCDTSHPSDRSL
jgi:hypothetical protein